MSAFRKSIAVFCAAAILLGVPLLPVCRAEEKIFCVYFLNAAEEAALARFCAAAAEGEPFACRLAVAAAMLNRLADPRFPDTVSGILAAAGFSAPKRTQKAYNEALWAVRAAAMGADPTGGAVLWARSDTAAAARIDETFCAGNLVFGRAAR